MTAFTFLATLVLGGLVATLGKPCCAYGGSGAALALGSGILSTSGMPELTPFALAASGSAAAQRFVTIMTAAKSGPDDSVTGWIVTQNDTAQTMTFWDTPSRTCHTTSVLLPDTFVPGFDLCGGSGSAAAPLFPATSRNFTMGGTPATVFWQPSTGATLTLLSGAQSCDIMSISAPMSPLGTGAFEATFETGVPGAPEAWAQPPSWCV